jgi:predicted lipoprotein with Yx(FWY)xxD motif
VLAAAALLAAGCSSSAGKADPYKIGALPAAAEVAKSKVAGHWVKENGGAQLRFTGTVTPTSAAELAAMVTPSTKTIVATVAGGDMPAGLAIGQTVQTRKLGLEIQGVCAGPCADYWFPAAATRKTTGSGTWIGYVPDLSETTGASTAQREAEAKLYTAAGVDAAKFHTLMDAQLRESPGGSAASTIGTWMPDKADLLALGYPQGAVDPLWLPSNLASANAQARAWGQVVAYKNTLVGLQEMPAATPSGSGPAPSSGASGSATAHTTATAHVTTQNTHPAVPTGTHG